MPTIEEQTMRDKQANDQYGKGSLYKLDDVTLIKDAKKTKITTIYKVPSNGLILIKDTLFNSNSEIRVNYPGTRIINPLFRETYMIYTNEFNISLDSENSQDGRYNQGIGQGDDINIDLRIKCKVNKSPESYRKLMIQKDTYKAALRNTAETMMKLLVQKYYQKNSHAIDLSQSNELRNKIFDIEGMTANAKNEKDLIIQQIIKLEIDLTEKYGIEITEVNFFDVDESERIKNIKAQNIEAENKRKREEAQAEVDKKVAEMKAEAERIRIETEINELKKQGFTVEQIAYYYTMKNMPENAIIAMGQGVSPMQDYMATNIAVQKMAPLKRVKKTDTTNNEPEEIDANELEKGHSK